MPDEAPVIGDNEKIYLEILNVMRTEAGQLSRLVITLSSGGIVLSATLLRDLLPADNAFLLICSWLLLLISMILSAYVIHFVPKFYYQFLGLLWEDKSSKDYGTILLRNRDEAEKLAKKYSKIKCLMLICLFLGMLSLVAFVATKMG